MPAAAPVATFILKVASRCNLDCDYCYVYHRGDESYRHQPYTMSGEVVAALLARVADHVREVGLGEVSFIFHGGEPLLAGQAFFRGFVRDARAILGSAVDVQFALETNGTLLSADWLDLFVELGIAFGISLDPTPETHDAHRVNHAGRGSYARVRQSVARVLADARLDRLFGGVLSVIDLSCDPLQAYRHLRGLGVRRCDLLLPDGTHDRPPAGLVTGGAAQPYAGWLIAVFDAWFVSDDPAFSIRLFEEIIALIFSADAGFDALGGGRNAILVIETDGGIEPVDVLKICGGDLTKLGLNVRANAIREACASLLVQFYQSGRDALCAECLACPVVAKCGGGYLPHRYSARFGFANPSVYCHDLMKLITHIRDRVIAGLPEPLRRKLGLEPLSFARAAALLAARQGSLARSSPPPFTAGSSISPVCAC